MVAGPRVPTEQASGSVRVWVSREDRADGDPEAVVGSSSRRNGGCRLMTWRRMEGAAGRRKKGIGNPDWNVLSSNVSRVK